MSNEKWLKIGGTVITLLLSIIAWFVITGVNLITSEFEKDDIEHTEFRKMIYELKASDIEQDVKIDNNTKRLDKSGL